MHERGEVRDQRWGRRGAGRELLSVNDRVFAEAGVGAGEGAEHRGFGQRAEAVEDAESVVLGES